jgi:hypothetical protein
MTDRYGGSLLVYENIPNETKWNQNEQKTKYFLYLLSPKYFHQNMIIDFGQASKQAV